MEMTKRQAAFRADYRTRISAAYNGPFHVAVIYAFGFTAIWICAHRIHAPTWRDWLVVPATVLGANLFEWFAHRYVLHRPVKGLMTLLPVKAPRLSSAEGSPSAMRSMSVSWAARRRSASTASLWFAVVISSTMGCSGAMTA